MCKWLYSVDSRSKRSLNNSTTWHPPGHRRDVGFRQREEHGMPSAAVTVRWRQRAIVWSGSRHATHHSVDNKIKYPSGNRILCDHRHQPQGVKCMLAHSVMWIRATRAETCTIALPLTIGARIVTHRWLLQLALALELALAIDTRMDPHH